MAKFNEKISTILNSQLPEFVVADHPKFAQFLKTYYQLLESAELSFSSVQATDGILLQSETGQTNNLVLDSSRKDTARTLLDAGDKILLEETPVGTFTRGEIIKGQTSKATAVVLTENSDPLKIIISAQDKFDLTEQVVGQSSGATATIKNYKPNPVNNIVDLINYRDPDGVINHFLFNMRDEFLATLPENLAPGVNKRNLVKNIKSLYRSKGSARGHEMFFRILFNEKSETFYPREQMFKASDGQFDSLKVLRVIATVGDANQLIGRTITGQTSNATAIIENTSTFQIGDSTVTQLILNDDSINGTFVVSEEIQGTATDKDDYFIKANITGIPGTKNITNDGSLNSVSDVINVTAGGVGALFQVEEIGPGSVTEMFVDNKGTGYEIGDPLVFTNTGTNGSNASGFVKIVNGGIADQNGSTSLASGVEDRIVLEDATTEGDQYSGNVIVQEKFTDLQTVEEIFLTNGGSQYTSLPTATITSSAGTGATVRAYGDNIGKIERLKTVSLGRSYEQSPTPPILGFFNNMIVTNVVLPFAAGDTVSGGTSSATGTIHRIDVSRGLLVIKSVSGTFAINETITSSAGGTCVLKKLDVATATVNVVSVADTDGEFINEKGKISETTMRIQDSLYYQDYSYVIKVGRSIAQWRDTFKKTMHTAGFYFTGLVDIESKITVTAKGPVKGVTSGLEESPLLSLVNTLFTTVFGRRLGTNTDGTSLRANAHVGGNIDAGNDYRDPFAANTRDLTLSRPGLTINYHSRPRNFITDNSGVSHHVKSGYAYAGPRYGTLNRFANTAFGQTTPNSFANTFQNLNRLKVTGTKTALDGQAVPIFLLTSNEHGKKLSTKYALPTIIRDEDGTFDSTTGKFSSTQITFDNSNVL